MGIDEENEDKQENDCCQKWKQKLIKSENGRKMLRQGIRILEDGIQKAREEIEALKTECQKEQKQAADESRRALEERRLRLDLENEYNSLKMELASVSKRLSETANKIEDREVEHVESKKVNANEEKRLRELLEKERQATESERKKLEEMKKLVNTEKKKAEEQKKCADAAKKKAEEEKKHADAAKKKAEEEKKRADAAKKKAEEEKKHADAAKKKAEEERKFAEMEKRKFEEEKKRADAERKRAEDEKINREMVEKKLQQAELERQRAMEGRKHYEAKENGPSLLENVDRKKSEGEKKLKEQLKKERQQLKAERRRAEEEKSQRETIEREHSVLKEHLEKKHRYLEAELKRAEEGERQRETLEREQSVLKEELARVTQCLKAQEGQLNDTKRKQMEVQAVDGSCTRKRSFPQGKISCETAAIKPCKKARVVIQNNTQGNFDFNSSSLAKESPNGPSESEGPNPGISCLLEPSIGGSVEKQVQSSALHSTITSFSDRQLVESQGRVAVICSDSSKMRKHKKNRGLDPPKVSSATNEQVCTQVLALPEGPRIQEGVIDCNEKRPFLRKQGNDLKKSQESAGEIFTLKQTNDAIKKPNGPEILVDSIARLFKKEKKAVLMMEEKIIALKEALRVDQGTSCDGLASKVRESKVTRKRKRDTARNISDEPNFIQVLELKDQKVHESKPEQSTKEDWSGNCSRVHVLNQDNESQEDESHVKLPTGSREIPEFVRSRISSDLVGKRRDEEASNLVEVALNEQVTTESLFDFDIKKMLQLDNESDEELYMQATQSLLSPTLPEMPYMDLEDLVDENLDPFLEETSYNEIKLLTGKNDHTDVLETMKGVSSQLVDAKKPVELDKDLGCEKLTGLEGSCEHLLYQSSGLPIRGVSQSNIEEVIGLEDEKHRCLLESCEEQVIEVANICKVQEQRTFSDFWILSSCFQDENNSNNMFCNIQHYLDEVFSGSSKALDLERLILNFASNTKLSRENMVCICISTIMSNLTCIEASSEASSSFSPNHASSLWSKNLVAQINKVSSKPETKGTFLSFFAFDIILRLMTNFLIEGKVEVYTASSNVKQGCSNLNGRHVEAECGQFFVSHRIATFSELQAGSTILASFCLALGHVDCLYEVIYNVLRWCKKDSIWLLTIVHSIAFHCWDNSLQVSRSNLLGDTICFIILLLEGHNKGTSQSLQNNVFLDNVQNQKLSLCVHCPFAKDVLSMDVIVSSLLETLHSPISSYHGEQTPTGVLECPNSDISGKANRKAESQNMHRDASAEVNKLDVPMHESLCQNQTVHAYYQLSNLNDTVRALELFAQYLGWDWTYNELIPRLWRMAQPSVPEVFIAAIFVLLGDVGRFGVDCDGHEHHGVEELRCNLSTFLYLHCTNKGIQQFPFSSQLAATLSLYELISVNMKTSRSDQTESMPESADGEKVHLTHIHILRKWYSKLSAEQQSMLPDYLRADISVLTS